MFPWSANARAVMQNETTGWVKSIHETRYGELLGLVMVGPHVTDLVEAGVVAVDAEATVETVADGMAAHPTLSEAIKDRKSTRLNSSHMSISYAVFCLKKKKKGS